MACAFKRKVLGFTPPDEYRDPEGHVSDARNPLSFQCHQSEHSPVKPRFRKFQFYQFRIVRRVYFPDAILDGKNKAGEKRNAVKIGGLYFSKTGPS